MDYAMQEQINQLRIAREQIQFLGVQSQRNAIHNASPYSDKITTHIRQYDELRLYYSLYLQESYITRPAIIQNIDFDLWISTEGCTNLELMCKGNAPYAFDSPEGKIEIHHIGQDYSAPFAELTVNEHNEDSQLLHISREESWRKDKKKEKAFYKERADYWKKRAKRNYPISEHQFKELQIHQFHTQQDYLEELRKTCEVIYTQCDEEDLDYLSDLAGSFAMMRRVGAMTMGEFLKNSQEKKQAGICCTGCKSSDYVLHGSYQTQGERIQRYKCKKCGKVFSPLYKTLISGSKFSFRQWIKFIDCLYNGYTIKQIAKSCDISEHSAHENRTKLFYALKLLNDKVKLYGNVALDETYFPVSFKGNHSNQEGFVMPRAANKRGGENHKRGLSNNLVCVICAIDDNGNSVAKVTGTGPASVAKLNYVLQEHFGEDIFCLYSDKSRTLRKYAETCGLEIKQEKLLCKGTQLTKGTILNRDTYVVNRYLQIINSYHSRLKKFLNRFSGISTKYLSGYLYLFAWKERSKDREPEEAYKELLRIMTAPNHYLSVDEIANDGHLPDAISINDRYRKRISNDLERDKEIYRRYAAGETMTSIGADYGFTKQNVSLIIKKLRRNGMAYRTVYDMEKEQANELVKESTMGEGSKAILMRYDDIYLKKQQWTGTANEFNEQMSKEYGISIQTVKNTVSQMKRILKLRDEIFIYGDTNYRSLRGVYQAIYTDYLELKSQNPGLSFMACTQQLSTQHNFTPHNIGRIINIMTDDTAVDYLSKKRRLTKTETYNRDKAIFIDFLRWTGERKEFCYYAAQKYNLSYKYVYEILKYCLYADPDRYNMV